MRFVLGPGKPVSNVYHGVTQTVIVVTPRGRIALVELDPKAAEHRRRWQLVGDAPLTMPAVEDHHHRLWHCVSFVSDAAVFCVVVTQPGVGMDSQPGTFMVIGMPGTEEVEPGPECEPPSARLHRLLRRVVLVPRHRRGLADGLLEDAAARLVLGEAGGQ